MQSTIADPEALAVAQSVLRAGGAEDALYARVDLCRLDGAWTLMELELTEPSLFITYHPETANELARAIARRLA
jgi:hypothetical protein